MPLPKERSKPVKARCPDCGAVMRRNVEASGPVKPGISETTVECKCCRVEFIRYTTFDKETFQLVIKPKGLDLPR